jgi:uncharacterized protein (DUF305 family)
LYLRRGERKEDGDKKKQKKKVKKKIINGLVPHHQTALDAPL